MRPALYHPESCLPDNLNAFVQVGNRFHTHSMDF
jgi:hypothetical protein